jgi:type VI secretion system protein VasG
MSVDLKSLVGKLTTTARRGLEGAAGLAVSRTNYEVDTEHWFVKLLEQPDGDVHRILRHHDIHPDEMLRGLNASLDDFKSGSGRRPELSPSIVDVIQDAWLLTSLNYGWNKVRSGALFIACLQDQTHGLRHRLRVACTEIGDINVESLTKELPTIISGSSEDREVMDMTSASTAPAGSAPSAVGDSEHPALDMYTTDLTAQAASGKIDPVLGREAEIRQIIDILMRRRQNNPILTGEAGVGKTAVVEGFALRIASGDVPPPIQKNILRSLDLGLLQAGASVKGEFENRLKQVLEEVRRSPRPVIMFIDEAHTMIGAGGAEGQNDAANLLKPALARGELRTVAATTWAEYKKYFEKDPALTRRFQVVKIEEPSEEKAMEMMRGIVGKLQSHHAVSVLDEAIVDCVRLSHRYIPARQLPDKSVSVLDTACAKVAVGLSAVPAVIEDLRRDRDRLATERRILEREAALGHDHAARLDQVNEDDADVEDRLDSYEKQWSSEKDLIASMREVAEALQEGQGLVMLGQEPEEPADGEAAKPAEPLDESKLQELRANLNDLKAQLLELQGEEPLVHFEVDSNAVAEIIAAWTGIPVGRMVADEIQVVLDLADKLGARVIGQDHALEAIAKRIKTARANLDDPVKPIGVFMLAGPSGVGKTETALALAELMYGGERNVVSINMSEYQEAHTVSSLKGSPPGYVGYGEGGVLTEAVRKRPYSVVLLDEVEKAHPDVMELFFQVFDKGRLEDGEGREIDFRNTLILLTSNVGTDTIMKLCADPDTMPDSTGMAEAIRDDLQSKFPKALLGRMVVVPYYPIQGDALKKIIHLKLCKIARRMEENHKVSLEYKDSMIQAVADRCTESDSGARNIDQILTHSLLPALSTEFLSRMVSGDFFSRVEVGINDDGDFDYTVL